MKCFKWSLAVLLSMMLLVSMVYGEVVSERIESLKLALEDDPENALLQQQLDLLLDGDKGEVVVNPAISPGNVQPLIEKEDAQYNVTPVDEVLIRQGGDTIDDAFPITSLPFTDTGTTTGYTNDYDEVCPYGGSTAPDVVYELTTEGGSYDFDLCGSSYDTKIYVYDADLNAVGCNDDFYFTSDCGVYVSYIGSLELTAGTYYVVIDGYGSSNGDYILNVTEYVPCVDTLEPIGDPEIEPNGGYNSDPIEYDPRVIGTVANPTLITGTYWAGDGTRDTDWFNFDVTTPTTVTATVDVSCNNPMLFIIDTDGETILAQGSANGEGEGEEVSVYLEPGEDYWLWMGSQVYDGNGLEYNYNIAFYGITPPTIAHDPFPNTTDTDGPYEIMATVTDNDGVDLNSTFLNYRIDGGDYFQVPMTSVMREESVEVTASIPGQPVGTAIDYYIETADVEGVMTYAPATAPDLTYSFRILGLVSVPFHMDFEADDGSFFDATGVWGWGAPDNTNPDNFTHDEPFGPEQANSGTNVWGTVLDGDYPSSSDARLESGFLIDLTNVSGPMLSFYQWYSIETRWDGGNVKVSSDAGITWNLLGEFGDPYTEDEMSTANAGIPSEPGFSGTPTSDQNGAFWHQVTFDLSAYAGNQILLRFHFGSDGSVTYPGWYIDDLSITVPDPNLVGDIESELGGTDWDPADALTMFSDEDGDDIWQVSLTATENFDWSGGQGYQVLLETGYWESQVPNPGGANIHISFDAGQDLTFYLNRNTDLNWTPVTNHVWDNTMNADPHTWAIVGPWQGWDPASTMTQAYDDGTNGDAVAGDKIFTYERTITQADVDAGLAYAAARDGGWDFQIASRGYTSDGTGAEINFTANVGDRMRFEVDTNMGRSRVYSVPMNLYGAAESEITGGLDNQTNDDFTTFDMPVDGVHHLTLTSNADFAWAPGYQVVPRGNATDRFPHDAAVPLALTAGQDVTFTFVSVDDGMNWIPARNYVYDTVFHSMDNTFWVQGSWADDPMMMEMNAETGAYEFDTYFETGGTFTYYGSATNDMGEYQIGMYGLTSAATPIEFTVDAGTKVRFSIDPMTARSKWEEGPFEGDVLINELATMSDVGQWVELLNTTDFDIDASGWSVNWETGSATINDGETIPANGYLLLTSSNTTGFNMAANGDMVQLWDDRDEPLVIDHFAYGTMGYAPAPVMGWSASRIPDGAETGDDLVDFTLAQFTPDAENVGTTPNIGNTTVVVNELMAGANGFIELYNMGSTDVDLSGWIVVANEAYTISDDGPPGPPRSMLAPGEWWTLMGDDFPAGMLTGAADNVYLFNADGERVFQMGYGASMPDGMSLGLIPDGDIDLFGEYVNDVPDDDGYQYLMPTPDAMNMSSDEVPQNLAVSEDFAEVLVLTWDATPGALYYKVWRYMGDDAQYVFVADSDIPAYVDADVGIGETYTYAVSAVYDPDAARDNESNLSDPASGTVQAASAAPHLVVEANDMAAENLKAALTAAGADYVTWNTELFGSFMNLALGDFAAILWDAGTADADVSAYDDLLTAYLEGGGDLIMFAPGLTTVPSYMAGVVAGLAGSDATMAMGSPMTPMAPSVGRGVALTLDDAPTAVTLVDGAMPGRILTGNNGDLLAFHMGIYDDAHMQELHEKAYLGFSSMSVSDDAMAGFEALVADLVLAIGDDTVPTINPASFDPAMGSYVSGVVEFTLPASDDNLDRTIFTTMKPNMTFMNLVPLFTSQTDPVSFGNGITAHFDADAGAMVVSINTLAEPAGRSTNDGFSMKSNAKADQESNRGSARVDKQSDRSTAADAPSLSMSSNNLFAKANADEVQQVREGALWTDGPYLMVFQAADMADNGTIPNPTSFVMPYFTVDNTAPVLGDFVAPAADLIGGNETFMLEATDNLMMHQLHVTVELANLGAMFEFDAMTDIDPNETIWFDQDAGIGVTGIAYADGQWHFDAVNWPDDDFTLTAQVMDAAGNEADAPAVANYEVDGTAPMIMVDEFDPADGDTLSAEVDVVWPVTDPNMQTLTVQVTGPNTATFTGVAGQVRNFSAFGISNLHYDEDMQAWMFSLNTLVNEGAFWFDGSYAFNLTATDAVGNESMATVNYAVTQLGIKVAFAPESQTAYTGGPVQKSVELTLQYASNVFGYSLAFTFDPDYIEITDVIEGAFLASDGAPTSFVRTINNAAGTFSFSGARLGQGGITQDPNAVDQLVTIQYVAESDEAMMTLIEAVQDARVFYDPGLEELDVQFIAPLQVNFEPVPDVWWSPIDFNHNFVIDGVDHIGMAYAFGSTPASPNWFLPGSDESGVSGPFVEPIADIASPQGQGVLDGKVNSVDLAWFGLNFGTVCDTCNTAMTEEPTIIATPSGAVADVSLDVVNTEHILANDLVTVELVVNGAEALLGADLAISYNEQALEFVSISTTDQMGATNEVSALDRVADGQIAYSVARLNQSGVDVNGTIATITFRALEAGDVELQLHDITLLNSNFERIPSMADSYNFTVTELPSQMMLSQNYPNPFNPATTINFALPAKSSVTLNIYNASGQLVRTLVNDTRDAGYHSVRWDGTNGNGESVSSGVYFYTLTTDADMATRRMMLLK